MQQETFATGRVGIHVLKPTHGPTASWSSRRLLSQSRPRSILGAVADLDAQ